MNEQVEIRERDGKYEVWMNVNGRKHPFFVKKSSSRDFDQIKTKALKLAPEVYFGKTTFYR